MADSSFDYTHLFLPEFDNEPPSMVEYLQLPSTPFEAHVLLSKKIEHFGLYMIGNSIKAHRACNEAIIFMYGLSGAGKTSSLNHLFGFELIPKTHRLASDTNGVTEYVASMTSDAWSVTNLEIGFIDVPGWDDTRGDQADCINMATIEQFISSHPHLGSRICKFYPNVVLIVINVMDKRIEGDQANAAKMLRAMSHLDIIDKVMPNVIIILTHVMSIPPLFFHEKLESISLAIKAQARTFLGIDPPVVWLENEVKGFDLKREEDWTILSDNTRQPKNLFDKMIELMSCYEDEVGIEAVRLYFSSRGRNIPTIKRNVNLNKVSQSDIKKWYKIIVRDKKMEDTEITLCIKKYSLENPNFGNDKLLPLMYELTKAGIDQKSYFEGKTLVEIQDKVKGFQFGELEKYVLVHLFGVEPKSFPELVDKIGCGYNLETKQLTRKIINQPEGCYDSNGINIPISLYLTSCEARLVKCDSHFLNSTSVDASIIKRAPKREPNIYSNPNVTESFLSSSLEGKEVPATNETGGNCKFRCTVEQNLFQIHQSFYKGIEDCICAEFIQDVKKLPNTFIDISMQLNQQFKNFFTKYGQFVSSSCICGGSVTFDVDISIQASQAFPLQEIIKNKVQFQCLTSTNARQIENNDLNKILEKSHLVWKGGIPPTYCDKYEDLDYDNFMTWKNSLYKKPALVSLNSGAARMIPIYKIVHLFDQDKSLLLQKVFINVYPNHGNFTDINFEINLEDAAPGVLPFNGATLPRKKAEKQLGIEPKNREDATTNALSSGHDKSQGGFPGNAIVYVSTDNEGSSAWKKQINQLEIIDFIMCYVNKKKTFVQITNIQQPENKNQNENGTFMNIEFKNRNGVSGSLRIGHKQYLVSNGYKNVVAENLELGDLLYFADIIQEDNLFIEVKIHKITPIKGDGPFFIEIPAETLIIDGILCRRDRRTCFPAHSLVQLITGEKVKMCELSLDSKVLSLNKSIPCYSTIYMWAHYEPNSTSLFVNIAHSHGKLYVSPHHIILRGEEGTPVHAKDFRVGDIMWEVTSSYVKPVKVTQITYSYEIGLYCPVTLNSYIVVDNIAASVYSTPNESIGIEIFNKSINLHLIAHLSFAPIRLAYKIGILYSNSYCNNNTHIEELTGIHYYCKFLSKIYNRLLLPLESKCLC